MQAGGPATAGVRSILTKNLLEVFNERVDAVRRVALEQLWHNEGVFIDPEGAHHGKSEIDAAVVGLFARFANFEFSVNGVTRAYHGVGCLFWAYGPTHDPKRITGIDVGAIADGKLISLYTFVDPPLRGVGAEA